MNRMLPLFVSRMRNTKWTSITAPTSAALQDIPAAVAPLAWRCHRDEARGERLDANTRTDPPHRSQARREARRLREA
jgi:hypothetical protein